MNNHDRFPKRLSYAALAVAAGCLIALLSASPRLGQTQKEEPLPTGPTLKISTDVVSVYAVVKERKGRLIPSLTRDDFEVAEDNAPQQILYFDKETQTPLTMGVLVDTSPSQQRVLPIEQAEAKNFIDQVVRPKDLAFVLHFDLEVELLQDFTSDHRLLAHAIDETVINGGGQGVMPGPFPSTSVGGTHLHDAVYLAAKELLKNEVGRKVLIILSDGEDQGSRVKLENALEAAQKSDVIIYSVVIADTGFYWHQGGFYTGDSTLKKYSEDTGGRVIRVGRAGDTSKAFQEIAEELRTQYLLGYTTTNKKHDGGFRKIRVRVRSGDYKVQARRGYYAPID